MNKFYLIIFLIVPGFTFGQSDSTMTFQTNEFNLRYYNASSKDTIEVKDMSSLTLIKDSIITNSANFNINHLTGISFRAGNYGFWRGAKHGAIAGSIIGLFAIYAYGKRIDWGHEGGSIILLPILLSGSAFLGAITGGIISMSNGRYLDYKLSGTTDNKRTELIRLMEKWRKR